jgi:hypothetical protein
MDPSIGYQIVRDLSGVGEVIQAPDGGQLALPKVARPDLGMMWTHDLGPGLARGGWNGETYGGSVNVAVAASASQRGVFLNDYVITSCSFWLSSGASADIRGAGIFLDRQTGSPLYMEPVAILGLAPTNIVGAAGINTPSAQYLQQPAGFDYQFPVVARKGDAFEVAGRSIAAASGAYTLWGLLHGYELGPGVGAGL